MERIKEGTLLAERGADLAERACRETSLSWRKPLLVNAGHPSVTKLPRWIAVRDSKEVVSKDVVLWELGALTTKPSYLWGTVSWMDCQPCAATRSDYGVSVVR